LLLAAIEKKPARSPPWQIETAAGSEEAASALRGRTPNLPTPRAYHCLQWDEIEEVKK